MIKFEDGHQGVSIVAVGNAEASVAVTYDDVLVKRIYIDKDLYHLLQQAMPIIGAIVEGE